MFQDDQIGELSGPQIPHDTPPDHGIPPYAKLDDAGEAPASGFLRAYRPLDENVFDDAEENVDHYEHVEENELAPFENLNDYCGRSHREDTQAEFQRQNHFDPDDMDGDDTMDTIVYTTRDYGPSYQQHILSPDETYQQTLREDAQGSRTDYSHPNDMDASEKIFEVEEYYLGDDEENLQYQTIFEDTHNADLAAGTLPYAARLLGGYDETPCFEEEREAPRWVSEDNSDEYHDADEAFEYAIIHYENAGDYPYQLDVHDQYEGGFYQGPDEDCAYIPPEDRTQEERRDQVMHSVSDVDVEICGDPVSESTGHIYDYRTGGVYTPEYTYQFDPAVDIETEATATYAHLERYSDDLDQMPRIYSYPRYAHWTGSMGVDQDMVETQPSQGDA